MRKVMLLGFLLLVTIISACSVHNAARRGELAEYEVTNTHAELEEGDFIYRLVTERGEYNQGDRVTLYAELEYIGEKDEVTIYHAASPFHFPIVEKVRNYKVDYFMNEPLVSTVLKKGEPYQEEYKGSGGYSSEDDKQYVAFVQKIAENQFPSGYYVVSGFADFFLADEEGQKKKGFQMNAQIDFKVLPQ
ncbi:hypothetical protein [Halalkalibacter alkaliphilus]|uniref:Lipoprotein n=1 Tax=Halalkalibacter alkaliphilus TaxID=2917993 RepID=A0A9X2CV60_9BACI|nr:hypothetical protein [Halalkalibacter alkaliphilus]MCL7748685.1 hypothetical protein [Halalkalibacter alkaliphilus]